MKQYILFILLIILIASCAPKVEVEKAKQVEQIPVEEVKKIEEPKEIIPEEPKVEEISLEKNTIEIKEDSIYPKEKTIEKDTEIEWVNKDKKEHKIACYLSGIRVTTSSNLKEEDSFTYRFLKEGDYTCIDAIYGLRSTITVKSQQPLLSPTADVVREKGESAKMASLTTIILVAIVALLFFIYSRKRR